MTISERNNITTLYLLSKDSEKSKEYVMYLVYEKIHKLKNEIYDLQSILKAYENLEKDLRK